MACLPQSPGADSRDRYTKAFTSRIFEPAEPPQAPHVPAGKRRDQTTAEMFGSYADKDLHAMPKTFSPKGDPHSAREKKLQFLSSDVLHRTAHQAQPAPAPQEPAPWPPRSPRHEDDEEEEEPVDPIMRRQQELSSELFGRETPYLTADEVHDAHGRGKRLTPSDFKWFSVPEAVPSAHGVVRGGNAVVQVTHQDRSYQEKCSGLFGHRSPDARVPNDADKQENEEHSAGELKRRANAHYSDLFGRSTPMDLPQGPSDGDERGGWRPKCRGPDEDQIVVHQDWTDSKTELMRGSSRDNRQAPPESSPSARKVGEFNRSRVTGGQCAYAPAADLQPVTTDNSGKLRSAMGGPTQRMHQAHLRSSLTPEEFYEQAADSTHWEVVELHLSGLQQTADERKVRFLCQGFDLQVVKVAIETDPVSNFCKGRARVMLRYNPRQDSVSALVHKLQEMQLRVEL